MSGESDMLTLLENQRLEALAGYEILDTPPDEVLDSITRHAATIFHVPISLISIVDSQRIWFKSKFGFSTNEIPRDLGLCSAAIRSGDLYIIENGVTDPRTQDYPWVISPQPFLFYAAVPLKMSGGNIIGTLCIVDKNPRCFSNQEQDMLRTLAQLVIAHIESQSTIKHNTRRLDMLLGMGAHELRNSLTSIPVWAEMVHDQSKEVRIKQLALYIQRSSNKMMQLIDQLKDSAHADIDITSFKVVDFSVVTTRSATASLTLAARKDQRIYLHVDSEVKVMGDELSLYKIVDNLVSNAIKYSFPHTDINIHLTCQDDHVELTVTDQGPGLTDEDFTKVFLPFSKLSARPTAGESSTGLGLSIIKQIVNAHKGRIWCRNNTGVQGASFIVELPYVTLNQRQSG